MKQLIFENWIMKKCQTEKWYNASVPGSVYQDYLNANLMPDPFWRENEYEALNLCEYDFEYSTQFNVDSKVFDQEHINLVFEGLDTVAEVILNGETIAHTDNMHRTYRFDVKDKLKLNANEIHIIFTSPNAYIKEAHSKDPIWGTNHAIPGFPHLRKAHCMFGWDWGPQLPDMGIWKDVYLEGFSFGKIEDVHILQEHKDAYVRLNVEVLTDLWADDDMTLCLTVTSDTNDVLTTSSKVEHNTITLNIDIENPNLWWPNNYGKQPLYTVEIELLHKEIPIHSVKKRIGLRTLTVRTEKDQWGESFEFVINGVAIFMMGGNYIPEDNIIARTSYERTQTLIESCVAANMNCIRVWGGGYYPMDYFYDLCDEYGLVVWQDLMFACAVYRMTDVFTANIIAETQDNLKRIRHHASLGIICGNNEMEEGLVNWANLKDCPLDLKTDYVNQYEFILPTVAKKVAPEIFYWKSSPSSGGHFITPNSENMGDVHEWAVWHGREPFTYYHDHYYRFLSEFGLQSYPSMKTIKSFTLPEDRNIFSPVMENHQKNGDGNGRIFYYISETYKCPKNFENTVYASQLVQAEGMKYAVEHLRRHRGRCMGAIYWQLNDCWPVASWSSIDYFGRWKALQYAAKRFFNPILISAEEIKRDLNDEKLLQSEKYYPISPFIGARITITNDTLAARAGFVNVTLKNHKGHILFSKKIAATVDALSCLSLESLNFSSYLDMREKARTTYLEFNFTVDGQIMSSNTMLFVKAKHFEFLDPYFETDITETVDVFIITLKSQAFAKYVELDLTETDGIFSDNYFDLPADQPVTITCSKGKLSSALSLEEFNAEFTIKSLKEI